MLPNCNLFRQCGAAWSFIVIKDFAGNANWFKQHFVAVCVGDRICAMRNDGDDLKSKD
jgi:hypothetical protein